MASERISKTKLGKTILKIVGRAGLISVALIAPNSAQLLGILDKSSSHKSKREYRIRQSVCRLVDRGYLVELSQRGDKMYRLTKKGEQTMRQLELDDFEIIKPKRWDGKWRIVIFDIPEKYRKSRNYLRYHLNRLEFVRLQDSVWISPYDCSDFLDLINFDLHLGRNLLHIIAERVDNDAWLKKHFDLN